MPPKRISAVVRVELDAGQASTISAGRALGTHGIALGQFIAQYNERTAPFRGTTVSADVTIYDDRSFTIAPRTPATRSLLLQAAAQAKGSGSPNGKPAAWITREQLRRVATMKLPDLNAYDVQTAERVVAGTARSMGIGIRD